MVRCTSSGSWIRPVAELGPRSCCRAGAGRRRGPINSVVFPLATGSALVLRRAAVGAVSGRWLNVRLLIRRVLITLVVLALAALEVRQQLHAALLTATWTA